MRTVRLVRGVVFLLFSYLVCLSWVFVFSLTWFASPPLGAFSRFFVLLLGLFSCLGFFLGFFLGFAFGVVLGSCWGRAGVVLGACLGFFLGFFLGLGVAAFLGVFLPPGVFPGGLVAFGLCGFLEGDVCQFFLC